MPVKIFASVLLSLFVFSCAPRPIVPPETVPIEKMAETVTDPRRAASLRVTEEGRVDLLAERYERGAQKLARAIEIDATNPFAYFYLGLARFRVGRFAEAGDLFSRSAGLFSSDEAWRADALAFRGESLEKGGRPAEAKRAYEEALQVDSGNVRAQDGLSRLSGEM
jgi:tetratricopeptide (TPR) repeat protein